MESIQLVRMPDWLLGSRGSAVILPYLTVTATRLWACWAAEAEVRPDLWASAASPITEQYFPTSIRPSHRTHPTAVDTEHHHLTHQRN